MMVAKVNLFYQSQAAKAKGLDAVGAGVGSLDDGSKIKVVIGDAAGTLGW